ncbi:MAG: hypothetical protein Q9191_002898 [Dirinaria sp. TL-2023a]
MARERRNWTAREDELLERAVEQAGSDLQSIQWSTIAANVPGRTNKDCRKRYYYKVSATVNKGTWTKVEDDRLRAAVQKYGLRWTRVAAEVGTRSGDQCSKRWNNTLDPAIDQSPWSPRDTKTLLRCVEQQGHNWSSIVADHFPGRTALSARNQYNYMCRRPGVNRQSSTPSSLHSSNSSQARTRSSTSTQSGRPSLSSSAQTSSETVPQSEGNESDYLNDSLSDDDDGDEDWPPENKSLPSSHVKEVEFNDLMESSPGSPSMSTMDIDSFWPAASSNSLPQFPSLDQTFPNQATYTESDHQMFHNAPFSDGYLAPPHDSFQIPQAIFPNLVAPSNADLPSTTREATDDQNAKKTVTITATCSRAEIRQLMQTTAEELQYINFTITSSQRCPSPKSPGPSQEEIRHVVITTTCPATKLGRLMEMVSDTLGSVSFSVCPSVDKPN